MDYLAEVFVDGKRFMALSADKKSGFPPKITVRALLTSLLQTLDQLEDDLSEKPTAAE